MWKLFLKFLFLLKFICSNPTVSAGVVSRDFCFEWTTGLCQYTVRSEVKTCPDPKNPGKTFYVYKLKYPPGITCNWAYCAYGWKLVKLLKMPNFYIWNRNISFSLTHRYHGCYLIIIDVVKMESVSNEYHFWPKKERENSFWNSYFC